MQFKNKQGNEAMRASSMQWHKWCHFYNLKLNAKISNCKGVLYIDAHKCVLGSKFKIIDALMYQCHIIK